MRPLLTFLVLGYLLSACSLSTPLPPSATIVYTTSSTPTFVPSLTENLTATSTSLLQKQ